jgi:hypothetical protein
MVGCFRARAIMPKVVASTRTSVISKKTWFISSDSGLISSLSLVLGLKGSA